LTKLGVKVRIVNKTAEPGTTSRALAVQARTLELYRQLDLTDAVLKLGHKVPAVNLWVKGEPATRLSFERIGSDLTPYSFLHIFPQDQHELLLIERLEALGVSVERRTELVSFTEEGRRVIARLRGPEGREETCEADYIAGCDGVHSRVRDAIGTGFPGGTYRQVFYVADVEAAFSPGIRGHDWSLWRRPPPELFGSSCQFAGLGARFLFGSRLAIHGAPYTAARRAHTCGREAVALAVRRRV
jgi:2-polyprenyl-6-methoxyphenol hydroxylase-like FAD-dependent oxidoreductase